MASYAVQECQTSTIPLLSRYLTHVLGVPAYQLDDKVTSQYNNDIEHCSLAGLADLTLQRSSPAIPRFPARAASQPSSLGMVDLNAHVDLSSGHPSFPSQRTTANLRQAGATREFGQIASMPAWKTMGAPPPKVKFSKARASSLTQCSRKEPRPSAKLVEDGPYDSSFPRPYSIPASKHGRRLFAPSDREATPVAPTILSIGTSLERASKYLKSGQLPLPEKTRVSSLSVVDDANGNGDLTSSGPPPKRRRLDADGRYGLPYTNAAKDFRSINGCASGALRSSKALDDFHHIAQMVRTARMPLHLQPSERHFRSQTVRRTQMARGAINKSHPNPHLRGLPADHPMLDEERGTLPPDACAQDQRLFAPREWLKAVKRCPKKTDNNLLHGGVVRCCKNKEAHISQRGAAGVCLACRVASHVHILNTERHLLGQILWPLCRSCGETALRESKTRRLGCRCGAGWLCHSCRHASLVAGSVKNGAEWDLRKGLEGIRCRCNKMLHTPEAKAEVTVLQCAGCMGVTRCRWTTTQEQILWHHFFRIRNIWTALDA